MRPSSPNKRPKKRSIPEALDIAKTLIIRGLWEPGDNRLADGLADLGYVGPEMEPALKKAFVEVRPEHYKKVKREFNVPGLQFIWVSPFFKKRVCLKFTLKGTRKKPRLVVWSCHEEYFGDETKN